MKIDKRGERGEKGPLPFIQVPMFALDTKQYLYKITIPFLRLPQLNFLLKTRGEYFLLMISRL